MRELLAGLAFAAVAIPASAVAQDSTPARGIFKSGEEVYAQCIATDQASLNRCDWFLMAAHDMATYYQDTKQIEVDFCVPKAIKTEEIRQVAVDRWRTKPPSRRYSAVSGFLNALIEKYPGPCKG